ncbi:MULTISPECIES: RluA family pseudouridine synthase [Exiguobacterium]|uniref:RluA family pseudouridine synthase n=1 Tax=Exiguobacterium TaxID=33986 RepID=UPI001BEB1978|nr:MULTISPECIES: RluA family pseudouridine synthase [Exiguobacterium]MCT4781895.1 RluA family pseudouridine synthase [Exiguobacterium himgiriensis]
MYGLTLRRVVGHNTLLRDFLMTDCGISRKMLAHVKQAGRILVNGEPKTVRHDVSVGDEVTIHFPAELPAETMVRSNRPLTVLYEDEWVLAVDKPAGIATIPSRLHPTDTLANAVLGYYQAIQLDSAIHVINRLDRDTSGVVLFAKYAYVHHRFSELQKQGGLTRTYMALVEGHVEPQTIDAPIGRAEHSIMERIITPDGQRAVTHVRQAASYGDVSALTIQLETGRTHQIRVHLRHLGHPLIGDTMYGGDTRLPRHALHSLDATFRHPLTDEQLSITAPIPEDFHQFLT